MTSARAKLMPLRDSVLANDVDAFRRALFVPTDGQVSLRTAELLAFGFAAPFRALFESWSFFELCFFEDRLELLRMALEADHPNEIDGRPTASKEAWARHLCTRFAYGTVSRVSMIQACRYSAYPGAGTVIEMALELTPGDVADVEATTDEAGRALIAAARMRRQIYAAGALQPSGTAPAPTAISTRRRLTI